VFSTEPAEGDHGDGPRTRHPGRRGAARDAWQNRPIAHEPRHRRPLPGRHLHHRLGERRRRDLARGRRVALLAVLGPGLLAGLSDDDPAGITTYSLLGQRHGYTLLWVLLVSTAALIVFHELGARLGLVTGKGLMALIRERFGARATALALTALVVANLGTMCAELAGVAAGAELLGGVPKGLSVPVAVAVILVLVGAGSFHRVEHVLLALSAVFATYDSELLDI
jgi:Mn2+/Fe2+ NRAMP family transporter